MTLSRAVVAPDSTAHLQPIWAHQERGPAFFQAPTDCLPMCLHLVALLLPACACGPQMYLRKSQRADLVTRGVPRTSQRLYKEKRKQTHRRGCQLHSARQSVNVYLLSTGQPLRFKLKRPEKKYEMSVKSELGCRVEACSMLGNPAYMREARSLRPNTKCTRPKPHEIICVIQVLARLESS